MALVVNAKWRQAPTSHDGPRSKARNGSVKLPVGQAFDASRDFGVQIGGGSWISFVEVGDCLDDVGDRLFGVGDLQRPRAASMISRARFASTTRPWR